MLPPPCCGTARTAITANLTTTWSFRRGQIKPRPGGARSSRQSQPAGRVLLMRREGLLAEAGHPAGRRDGDLVRGKVKDRAGTSLRGDLPSEVRDRAALDLILLLRDPVPLLQHPQLRGLLRRDTGPDPVIDVSEIQPAASSGQRLATATQHIARARVIRPTLDRWPENARTGLRLPARPS